MGLEWVSQILRSKKDKKKDTDLEDNPLILTQCPHVIVDCRRTKEASCLICRSVTFIALHWQDSSSEEKEDEIRRREAQAKRIEKEVPRCACVSLFCLGVPP